MNPPEADLTITPKVEGECLVLELSRHCTRLGFSLEEWEALKEAGDNAASVLRGETDA